MEISHERFVHDYLPSLIVMLKNVTDNMLAAVPESSSDSNSPTRPSSRMSNPIHRVHSALVDMNMLITVALHDFRLAHARLLLDEELGFWVLPRSTAWFSQFLLHEYDDKRWVELFRFTKASIFHLSVVLAPHCEKTDTKYRRAIPMRVRIACAVYKLVQGASLLQCSEFFAIGKSTVAGIVRDVVFAINLEFRNEISFPGGEKLQSTMQDFYDFCGMPAVAGAIDGTHIHIKKPVVGPEDYFYFKSGGYTMQMQAVVDRRRRFLDVAVGMPGSTHDSRVLRRSGLYQRCMSGTLFAEGVNVEGFLPYFLRDSGYPLLPWLLTPYRDGPGRVAQRSLIERLYNRRLSRGRSVVENAFGILKQSFRELLNVTNLDVAFVPDVVVACCLLHNILLGQDPQEVARLLEILQTEGLREDIENDLVLPNEQDAPPPEEYETANQKRLALGIFLGRRRNLEAE